MKHLQLPKARLKLAKSELKVLQLEFRNNPNLYSLFTYTIRCIALKNQIRILRNSIRLAKNINTNP